MGQRMMDGYDMMYGYGWIYMILGTLLIVGIVPWLLWARGIIAFYNTARVLALLLTMLVLTCGFYQIHQTGRRSQSLQDPA